MAARLAPLPLKTMTFDPKIDNTLLVKAVKELIESVQRLEQALTELVSENHDKRTNSVRGKTSDTRR